ncbi:MAG TPA: S4 domain-containing protein [Steroidobacteraceae bacterium]|nr:S4 domain-containing protein [Steroidobacteraceae bacterium]
MKPRSAPKAGGRRNAPAGDGERLQKLLSQLGLASRREAEAWIRDGRLSVNGVPAVLGVRVQPTDQLRLDGRLIRQRSSEEAPVFLVHRSPGEPLLPVSGATASGIELRTSVAERLPRSAGKRFMSVSPMPAMDGGLELLSADGRAITQLQRAVHGLEAEYSIRVRGELLPGQIEAALRGQLDSGETLQVKLLEASGGEGANRWYRLVALGASGKQIRQLLERQAATLSRILRVRLGTLQLERDMPRGHWRELTPEELDGLLSATNPVHPDAA